MTQHLLSLLICLPLVGAVFVLFAPRQSPGLIRTFSTAVSIFVFGLSLSLLKGSYTQAGYQFVERYPWIDSYGIAYKVGVDGISLWLVLLTTLMTPIALYASWLSVSQKIKEYAFCFLLLEASMIGTLLATDLFLFYIFWEMMLIPMVLIIGLWGGSRRVYASVKFFLYTLVGSLLMLAAILYLVAAHKAVAGAITFDLEQLERVVLPHHAQMWAFIAFALAFGIKVPMFPFHTWLPDAHVEAPTGGSVILAAVLLKMGCYGFIRFAMPLFPWASHQAAPTLALLCIVGIVYGAFCAWVQEDLKKLVAYSSVSHLGFIMLGVVSMSPTGVSGAVLQMAAHGISTGALFLLVGVIYDRRHTRELSQFGGLAKPMPLYAAIFVIVAMSSIGLPLTNGFIGEFMILSGTFVSSRLTFPKMTALVAATGVILSAVYMLYAILRMFWGPIDKEENKNLLDVQRREMYCLAPLILLIFWMGIFPRTFLKEMNASVDQFMLRYNAKLIETYRNDTQRLLPLPNKVASRERAQ